MSHPIYRVRWFEIVAPYTLRVGFDDNNEQTIDFRPVLTGELFGPLPPRLLFRAYPSAYARAGAAQYYP